MRIVKEHEERKNDILDAAELLFISKGYVKTTVNDILQAVGIAKGTFYHYFKSKEEVMDAVIMRMIDAGVETAKKIAADSKLTIQEKLFQIIMAQRPNKENNREQMIEELHHVNNAEMHQKSLVESIRLLSPILAEVVEQGVNKKVFQTPFPRESVEFLLTSSQFLFDEGLFHWQPHEILQKAKAFIYIMEQILGAEKGSFDYIFRLLTEQASNK
ncbi:TetR/AcrR family transcriptional regulator [Bacillus chungangensis]|uniref:AcrR family transcriptional regulator n=1 Tax=Bacillus chungangensis TaxID=587633 RepID=A0ABT9WMC1_9BACI|nr:TetR/AcrR family transcriptional regulator [Bacillus chungangensis]MDQ0174259.1 AcrR family transcriptional regulator [Bacillus chungangensis]